MTTPTPEPQVERRELSTLHAHPRQHEFFRDLPPEKLAALAEDMRVNGLRTPVEILPDGTIVAGHGRVDAGRSLGWTHIAVIVRHDLAEQGEQAVVNRLIEDNLIRRQMTKLEQAQAYEHLREQIRREPKGPDSKRRLKKLAEQMAELGLEGRNLNRYLAVLRTPKAIQDAFDQERLSLVSAARVDTMSKDAQNAIAGAIEAGDKPADAVATHRAESAAPVAVSCDQRFDRFIKAIGRGLASLKDVEEDIYRTGSSAEAAIAALTQMRAFADRMLPRLKKQLAQTKARRKKHQEFIARLQRSQSGVSREQSQGS